MKKANVLLLFVLLAINVSAQNENFIYTNANYGLEIKFPSKPVIVDPQNIHKAISATLNLPVGGGLAYKVEIWKLNASGTYSNYNYGIKKRGRAISHYEIGNIKAVEAEVQEQNGCYRYKIVKYDKAALIITVSSQTCVQDKDVFPFFNSLKIDGQLIQNPNADNSKFKTFAIDYPSKPDTVKQIVYVNAGAKNSYQFEKLSDVDKNIPQNAGTNPYRFALIIGNEDYSSYQANLKSESNVDFARNDASAFKEYCINTLGVPEKNITFLLDATVGQITQGITKLNLLSKACNGKSQLMFFYAGHGLPDETTKEPYLIPVDVSGANVTAGIKLNDLYKSLTEFPSERVTVFLDACFTGGSRNAGLIAGRSVKINPKINILTKNIIVFSSSSSEQSSLSYAEKNHGMFTYFLLKKIQETKGELTYSELFDFLNEKIPVESLLVNSKEQNPVINTSQDILETWKQWTLK